MGLSLVDTYHSFAETLIDLSSVHTFTITLPTSGMLIINASCMAERLDGGVDPILGRTGFFHLPPPDETIWATTFRTFEARPARPSFSIDGWRFFGAGTHNFYWKFKPASSDVRLVALSAVISFDPNGVQKLNAEDALVSLATGEAI